MPKLNLEKGRKKHWYLRRLEQGVFSHLALI